MNAPGIRLLSVGSLLFATSFAPARSVENVGGCTPGTYLAVEGSGTRSIWTFSSDGTFQATSSAERLFTFSHIQRAWQRDGGRGARAVRLHLGFASQPAGADVCLASDRALLGKTKLTWKTDRSPNPTKLLIRKPGFRGQEISVVPARDVSKAVTLNKLGPDDIDDTDNCEKR